MLPRDLLGPSPATRPAAATPVEALGDPRQQAFQRALAGQVGQPLRAQVLARLADGSTLVRVADTPARMMLPPGAALGSEVPLTLVAVYPRPTFQYGAGPTAALIEAAPAHPEESPGAPPALPADAESAVFTAHDDSAALVYRPDGRGPAAGAAGASRETGEAGAAGAAGASGAAASARSARAAPAAPLPAAISPSPGDAGATLSPAAQVLGSVLAAVLKLDQPARAVAARAPVLAAPSGDAAALAPALRQAVEQSGLFYESHVAEWAQGRRDLALLASEPQMQDRPANPAEPDSAQLINLQLGAHEQDRVAWQGQLWPGQPLQWEISRDAPERQPGAPAGGDAETPWRSRLTLRFAGLGELEATVVLHAGQVAIQVAPEAAATAALLRLHTGALADALAAAGTPLTALAIVEPDAGAASDE